MDLGDIVERSARYWPERFAVIDSRRRTSYRDFDRRTNQLANALLSLGLTSGDRVAIQAWNCCELVEAEVALYKSALIKVPVNARLSTDETVHVLNDSTARALVVGADHAAALLARRSECPQLRWLIVIAGGAALAGADHGYETLLAGAGVVRPAVRAADADIAVLHYTSGSSGVLKAAMQSFANRRALVTKTLLAPWRPAAPGDVMAHVGPVTHASGMQLMPMLQCGATNLLLEKFDERLLLEAIERERVSRLFLVPTMVNRLVAYPELGRYDLSSLRLIVYGAAPMAPSLVRRAIEMFGPILAQGYGAGETTSLVSVLNEQDHVDALAGNERRLSSCGRCYFDTEMRVVDDEGHDIVAGDIGEIIVKGPDVMLGYWNAPELTAEAIVDGAYRTGDLATVDDEGYVYIVDRKKEMIISGGFNIYPTEIEQHLYAHPAVFEGVAIGVPDDEWGEAVKLVVVRRPGAVVDDRELLAWCASRLPGYKKPRSVDFIDELPKNANGKVMRKSVRDSYWVGRERNV